MSVHKCETSQILKGGIAMAAALAVDQSLVDNYLARVDRFVSNVGRFEEQLKEMTGAVKERFAPESAQMAGQPVSYEPAATKPEQAVVTADDIDIDALLSGVDLGGMSL